MVEKNGLKLFKRLKAKAIKHIKELMFEFDLTMEDLRE
jgi:hypothetical protein